MDEQCEKKYASDEELPQSAVAQMIIKLRWIGLEDEARQLELKARRLPAEQRGAVSLGLFSTD